MVVGKYVYTESLSTSEWVWSTFWNARSNSFSSEYKVVVDHIEGHLYIGRYAHILSAFQNNVKRFWKQFLLWAHTFFPPYGTKPISSVEWTVATHVHQNLSDPVTPFDSRTCGVAVVQCSPHKLWLDDAYNQWCGCPGLHLIFSLCITVIILYVNLMSRQIRSLCHPSPECKLWTKSNYRCSRILQWWLALMIICINP